MTDLDNETNFQVDDDGFVLLITPDSYDSYIDRNWTLEQITTRFTEQMTARSMFAAYVGQDAALHQLTYGPPALSAVVAREASSVVDVAEGGLWLTDYTQITMAAQFEDEQPIGTYSTRLPVDPGRYEVRLHQLDTGALHLTVVPSAVTAHIAQHSVPWFDL
ncbi:hypothetical protein AXK56_11615 [Tsukamurella pulmonis]|uniref:Uncharacterized protein n=1 Tax=Tsukamurella pulmonis TaxID=47312 RepID=A0A1H1H5F5_9ACTN|nr:hypothetical protein [Tsukamurella pulmonis]KXO88027.1 hypothetical protein AXK56_11615 [Tsukamurella pulmonis]SDR20722.1 hypothetical protein SAMN04489765_3835 [Tsukamurella pulmonis]SUP15887.1 Uncharacterised protein [Tsukamurella pulmonis]